MIMALVILCAFSMGFALMALYLAWRFKLAANKVKVYTPDQTDEQRGSNGVLYLHGRSGPLLVPADADPNDPCCQVPPEDLELPEHSEVKKNAPSS